MNPLFVASLDELKARLRLSSIPSSSSDTQAIVDDAVLRARLSFYRRLGETDTNALALVAEVPSPTTEAQVRRSVASSTEVMLVQLDLYRRLPAAWMDASGDLQRRWNAEAPFRERARTDLELEMQRLERDIEENMQILAGSDSVGDESRIRAFDGTPTFTPPRPGSSLDPWASRIADPD